MRYSEIVEWVDVRDSNLDFYDERTAAHEAGLAIDPSWAGRLSERESQALIWYRASGDRLINNQLNGRPYDAPSYDTDPEEMHSDLGFHMTSDEAISLLDAALGKCRLQHDIVVYRGLRTPAEAARLAKMRIGATTVDKGFLSSSLSMQTAAYGFTVAPQRVVMRILLHAGAKAAYLSHEDGTEAEMLIGRGQTMRLKEKKNVEPEPGRADFCCLLLTFDLT